MVAKMLSKNSSAADGDVKETFSQGGVLGHAKLPVTPAQTLLVYYEETHTLR